MNFLETILDNPKNLQTIAPKPNIDVLTHDFDSETLSERLHSLYSVLVSNVDVSKRKVKDILLKYQPELAFLREANKPTVTRYRVGKVYTQLQEKLAKCKQ